MCDRKGLHLFSKPNRAADEPKDAAHAMMKKNTRPSLKTCSDINPTLSISIDPGGAALAAVPDVGVPDVHAAQPADSQEMQGLLSLEAFPPSTRPRHS